MKNKNNKKVYVVLSRDGLEGVFTSKEKAMKAKESANNLESLRGGFTYYYMEEVELNEEEG